MAFSYKMTLFIMLLIIFTILVAFPQFGAASRALQEDEWLREYNGLLLQSFQRGTPVVSSPDPIRP
ncbi:hypothetical protein GLYMA_19G162301v4 [Glycine max]|nr:hypothetical protein GLYMA_19G162301v4 [Glycine max]KAG4913212.1 hypothetical protein JHK86_053645 [Glycine max]KAG5083632.1 hypothetical protein JHK84_053670 [Glycine max]KAH1078098.1 hypothetical protein GYH30_053241 [Glycine max]KHN02526.1 hypothetical protein glysoja_002550 [Glycine soja]